jgi:predicted GNAT family acetyltransferase
MVRKKEVIPVKLDIVHSCSVHDRFQSISGQWIPRGENGVNLEMHLIHTRRREHKIVEGPCDECESS